jgi:acyl dehydratase
MSASLPRYADVEVGTQLPGSEITITRFDLVRYAGASGDFNIIHWNERFATSVGLPNVIAHGMLTMAQAGRVVTDWIGDPGAMKEFGVRFTRPVPVADDDKGALVTLSAEIVEKGEDNRVRVDITATHDGAGVLGRAFAVVQLA